MTNARNTSTGTVHSIVIWNGTAWARCDHRKQLRTYKVTDDSVTCRRCQKSGC